MGYAFLGESIPIYPVYALLLAQHGLSAAEISSLFVVWSATTFLLEVPSGAWADVVSRRVLLAASAVVNGIGYALWVVWPGYAGFLLGFVLWGLASALASGTFEALTYDELAATGQEHRYAQVIGWTTTAGLVGLLLANLAAAPLIRIGGIELTGWVSLGVCGVNALLALALPRASRHTEATDVTGDPGIDGRGGPLARWWAMLRAGTREATTRVVVRRAVLLTAAMYGFLAFDEYFGLVFADLGATAAAVALLTAVTAAAQAVAGLLAGPAARLPAVALAALTAVSAAMIGVGAALSLVPAVVGISAGYGVLQMVLVVTEARLQDSIEGPARATVTSVAGLGSEVLAMGLFAGFALGSLWLGYAALVTVLAVAPLLVAGLVPRWLPEPRDR